MGRRVPAGASGGSRLIRLLAAIFLLLPGLAVAQIDPADLLPVDEAFAPSAAWTDEAVELTWDIAPGYYLYRHAFRFRAVSDGLVLREPEIPAGTPDHDEFFGDIETYRDRVTVSLPVARRARNGPVEIETRIQGCADLGVCYPPHTRVVALSPPASSPAATSVMESAAPAVSASAPEGGGLAALLGGGENGPLPPEEAFVYEAIALDESTALVRFTVHDGYYLYRDSLQFRVPGAGVVSVDGAELPPAEPIFDEYFGDTHVYYNEVEIPVRFARPAGGALALALEADFQGCQTDGICYPPMSRVVSLTLPAADRSVEPAADAAQPQDSTAVPAGAAAAGPVSEQDRLAGALAERPALAMALFFLAGILLAFTPCVFPMVPILSGLIAGQGDRITTGGAFRLSLVYVLAMAVVYTIFGVVAALLGQNLQAAFQHPAVLAGFAALFVLLSLAMFGFYELQLPSRWQTRLNEMSNRAESGTLWGAAIMGALSALVVGPCVAPALMGALIYIGQTGDAVLGGGALFAMALGMGVPLVVWGTSAGRLLPRAGAWMNAVKAVFGVGLLALAIWMLERMIPPAVTMLLWGALAIACGVYLGALTRLPPEASGWRKLWQALGVMLLVAGILQFIGAAAGGRDWTRPLAGLSAGTSVPAAASVEFAEVRSLEELQRAVAGARRPVFLDFYADWCVDCKRMERRTFTDPDVARRLQDFELLKINVTDYNDEHKRVLEHFGLIGPPAYLFFHDGQELQHLRMFGFMTPRDFLDHLARIAPGS